MTCADCRNDNHDDCTGGTWDDDGPTICDCWMQGHEDHQ